MKAKWQQLFAGVARLGKREIKWLVILFASLWLVMPQSALAACAVGNMFNLGKCTAASTGILSGIVCQFENVLAEVLGRMYCGFQANIKPALTSAVSIAVLVFGIGIFTGYLRLTAREVAMMLLKITFVFALATEPKYGIDIAAKLSMGLLREGTDWVIASLGGDTSVTQPDSVFEGLINFFNNPDQAAMATTNDCSSITGIAGTKCLNTNALKTFGDCAMTLAFVGLMLVFFMPAIIVFLITMVMQFLMLYMYSLLSYLGAIMMLSFLFALSPMFLCFFLFRLTQPLFARWLQYVTAFSIQSMILFSFVALLGLITRYFTEFLYGMAMLLRPYDVSLDMGLVTFPIRDACSICEYRVTTDARGYKRISCREAVLDEYWTNPVNEPYKVVTKDKFPNVNINGGGNAAAIAPKGISSGVPITYVVNEGSVLSSVKNPVDVGDVLQNDGRNYVIPLQNLIKQQEFLMYIIANSIAFWVLSRVMRDFIQKAPDMASHLSGAMTQGMGGKTTYHSGFQFPGVDLSQNWALLRGIENTVRGSGPIGDFFSKNSVMFRRVGLGMAGLTGAALIKAQNSAAAGGTPIAGFLGGGDGGGGFGGLSHLNEDELKKKQDEVQRRIEQSNQEFNTMTTMHTAKLQLMKLEQEKLELAKQQFANGQATALEVAAAGVALDNASRAVTMSGEQMKARRDTIAQQKDELGAIGRRLAKISAAASDNPNRLKVADNDNKKKNPNQRTTKLRDELGKGMDELRPMMSGAGGNDPMLLIKAQEEANNRIGDLRQQMAVYGPIMDAAKRDEFVKRLEAVERQLGGAKSAADVNTILYDGVGVITRSLAEYSSQNILQNAANAGAAGADLLMASAVGTIPSAYLAPAQKKMEDIKKGSASGNEAAMRDATQAAMQMPATLAGVAVNASQNQLSLLARTVPESVLSQHAAQINNAALSAQKATTSEEQMQVVKSLRSQPDAMLKSSLDVMKAQNQIAHKMVSADYLKAVDQRLTSVNGNLGKASTGDEYNAIVMDLVDVPQATITAIAGGLEDQLNSIANVISPQAYAQIQDEIEDVLVMLQTADTGYDYERLMEYLSSISKQIRDAADEATNDLQSKVGALSGIDEKERKAMLAAIGYVGARIKDPYDGLKAKTKEELAKKIDELDVGAIRAESFKELAALSARVATYAPQQSANTPTSGNVNPGLKVLTSLDSPVVIAKAQTEHLTEPKRKMTAAELLMSVPSSNRPIITASSPLDGMQGSWQGASERARQFGAQFKPPAQVEQHFGTFDNLYGNNPTADQAREWAREKEEERKRIQGPPAPESFGDKINYTGGIDPRRGIAGVKADAEAAWQDAKDRGNGLMSFFGKLKPRFASGIDPNKGMAGVEQNARDAWRTAGDRAELWLSQFKGDKKLQGADRDFRGSGWNVNYGKLDKIEGRETGVRLDARRIAETIDRAEHHQITVPAEVVVTPQAPQAPAGPPAASFPVRPPSQIESRPLTDDQRPLIQRPGDQESMIRDIPTAKGTPVTPEQVAEYNSPENFANRTLTSEQLNADLEEYLATITDPSIDKDKVRERFKKLREFVATHAAINNIPVDIVGSRTREQIASATTTDGKHHIVLGSAAIVNLLKTEAGFERMQAAVGHEMGHIVRGDTTPHSLAEIINDPTHRIAQDQEIMADMFAAQMMGTHQSADRLAELVQQDVLQYVEQYNAANPNNKISATNYNAQDLERLSTWVYENTTQTHPNDIKRIAALKIQSSLMYAYERMNPPPKDQAGLKKYRDEQQRWIQGKIMEQIRDGTLPMPNNVTPVVTPKMAEMPQAKGLGGNAPGMMQTSFNPGAQGSGDGTVARGLMPAASGQDQPKAAAGSSMLMKDETIQRRSQNLDAALEDLHKKLGDGAEYEEAKKRYQKLKASIHLMGSNGGHNNIEIRVSHDRSSAAALSAEKKEYLILSDRDFERALASDEGLGQVLQVAGHEVGHIVRGDVTEQGLAAALASNGVSQVHELMADLIGSGPLGSNDPYAPADDLRGSLIEHINDYNAAHPGQQISTSNYTSQDLRKVSDWWAIDHPRHPPLADRVDYLEYQAQLLREYQKTHTMTTLQDRQQAAEWIQSQVLKAIQEKRVPKVDLAKDRPTREYDTGAPLEQPKTRGIMKPSYTPPGNDAAGGMMKTAFGAGAVPEFLAPKGPVVEQPFKMDGLKQSGRGIAPDRPVADPARLGAAMDAAGRASDSNTFMRTAYEQLHETRDFAAMMEREAQLKLAMRQVANAVGTDLNKDIRLTVDPSETLTTSGSKGTVNMQSEMFRKALESDEGLDQAIAFASAQINKDAEARRARKPQGEQPVSYPVSPEGPPAVPPQGIVTPTAEEGGDSAQTNPYIVDRSRVPSGQYDYSITDHDDDAQRRLAAQQQQQTGAAYNNPWLLAQQRRNANKSAVEIYNEMPTVMREKVDELMNRHHWSYEEAIRHVLGDHSA